MCHVCMYCKSHYSYCDCGANHKTVAQKDHACDPKQVSHGVCEDCVPRLKADLKIPS